MERSDYLAQIKSLSDTVSQFKDMISYLKSAHESDVAEKSKLQELIVTLALNSLSHSLVESRQTLILSIVFFAALNKENERSLCWAHVRAKFKYASDISKDKDTRIHFEDMMNTVLNYMINGWQELLNYRHDGRYDIDNTEAERKIRPLTIGRKNTLFFGSEEGVEVATTYYTIIETCKLNDISPLDYLTYVFRQLMMGNKDYESLLPGKLALKSI